MNIKKYLNITLLKLSKEYKITIVKIITYKDMKNTQLLKQHYRKKMKKIKQ